MAIAFADLPERPLYMQAAGEHSAITYTASDFRETVYATLPHQGRITPLALRVTPTSPTSWGITVGTGQYVIGPPGDQYIVTIRTPIDVPLTGFNTTPPAKRTSVVYLVLYDSGNMSSGAQYKAQILVAEDEGIGAGIPTDGYYMPLASVSISPGQAFIQSSHIINERDYTYHGLTARGDIFTLAGDMYDAYGVAPGTSPIRVIYRSGYLTFGGLVKRDTGLFQPGAVYTLGTINEPWRPKFRQASLLATTASEVLTFPEGPAPTVNPDLYVRVDVHTNGLLRLVMPYEFATRHVFLDGLRVELT